MEKSSQLHIFHFTCDGRDTNSDVLHVQTPSYLLSSASSGAGQKGKPRNRFLPCPREDGWNPGKQAGLCRGARALQMVLGRDRLRGSGAVPPTHSTGTERCARQGSHLLPSPEAPPGLPHASEALGGRTGFLPERLRGVKHSSVVWQPPAPAGTQPGQEASPKLSAFSEH